MNWNLPKQTILANREDENAPPGDCWRCCVAALLQIPACDVPHFVAESDNYESETQSWLNTRGLWMLGAKPEFLIHGKFGEQLHKIPVISCGPTPRSQNMRQQHAVITIQGAVVFDPHPSSSGLTAIVRQFAITRILESFS